MLTYPHINPIAISIGPIFGIGPLQVHWYGIMYLIGFVAAWWLAHRRSRLPGSTWTGLDIDDLISTAPSASLSAAASDGASFMDGT